VSTYLRPAQAGCLLAHYKVWQKILKSGEDGAFVFEHDAMFYAPLPDPSTLPEGVTNLCNHTWESGYWARRHMSTSEDPAAGDCAYNCMPGTMAYYVTRSAALALSNDLQDGLRWPADLAMRKSVVPIWDCHSRHMAIPAAYFADGEDNSAPPQFDQVRNFLVGSMISPQVGTYLSAGYLRNTEVIPTEPWATEQLEFAGDPVWHVVAEDVECSPKLGYKDDWTIIIDGWFERVANPSAMLDWCDRYATHLIVFTSMRDEGSNGPPDPRLAQQWTPQKFRKFLSSRGFEVKAMRDARPLDSNPTGATFRAPHMVEWHASKE
jgi:hypothetical protein